MEKLSTSRNLQLCLAFILGIAIGGFFTELKHMSSDSYDRGRIYQLGYDQGGQDALKVAFKYMSGDSVSKKVK